MENQIKELILKELKVDISEQSRKREIIEARALYFYLVRKIYTKRSLQSIASDFDMNHATVVHALKNFPMYENYNTKILDCKNLILHLLGGEVEQEMTECYFTPKKDTSSATICNNCGKEKFLHTIGEGIKVSTYIVNPKEEPKQETLEESKKVRYEIIQQLDDLLTSTEGTEQHNLIKLRLEAFYNMNKNIRL